MITSRRLANGLDLVVERIDAMQSCGLSWLVAGGTAYDEPGALGEGWSALLAEYMMRGAGEWTSRTHSDALDALGVDRRTSAATHHLVLGATLLSDHLLESLPLLAQMITAPRLDADHLEPVKRLSLQALAGLEDEPQHLAMVRVSERFFPAPFNRSGYGDADGIRAATVEGLRSAWKARVRPGGSILAIAGRLDLDEIAAAVEPLVGGWSGTVPEPRETRAALGGTLHVETPSAQTHLAMALWAPHESSGDAMRHRMAVRILGGESSSRLFTEVREKRGLCYSVGAGASLGRDRGITTIYAGSTPDRAATTLAQIRTELARFTGGITRAEYDRAVIGFKSRLIMQGESTSARASALALDHHRLGRARSLEELAAEVDAVSLDSLNEYATTTLAQQWSTGATLVVVGPRPLEGA